VVAVAAMIAGYLDHLRVERAVSPHTLSAYRRDLGRYAEFLSAHGVTEIAAVTGSLVAE